MGIANKAGFGAVGDGRSAGMAGLQSGDGSAVCDGIDAADDDGDLPAAATGTAICGGVL